MCEETKFLICKHCGNIIGMIKDTGVPVVCCGEDMTLLVPNTVDAASEKHVPVIEVADGKVTVTVGSTIHPMLPEHHIEWIYLITTNGRQRKCLSVTGEPEAEFCLAAGEMVIAAYEYCNLHGLWKADYK
ncbi:MAG: desulfoferrodoxin family protein [Eubacteriales bacterium]|nr:desulfoferrodoxin family protein [Eubacteriales bacterium]MDD3350558.1 desulfoferrodoxin family protein [Eubacteriales bacterium]